VRKESGVAVLLLTRRVYIYSSYWIQVLIEADTRHWGPIDPCNDVVERIVLLTRLGAFASPALLLGIYM
jgi:hypothetical protein